MSFPKLIRRFLRRERQAQPEPPPPDDEQARTIEELIVSGIAASKVPPR